MEDLAQVSGLRDRSDAVYPFGDGRRMGRVSRVWLSLSR
ncbi:hypothetical protein Sulac_3113 [Sulfobacillus acidophilus DSM 10332]|uniref:Uncharacterized protein n=1 Tax=Sulfobacillus acidophilus (strain ATCC 700253 / DSM 10332 / NAL) TaxID=679936 RepID=G8U115_SULAD|nr:hypothetical protein Sulac_3113 [Sulfobacillus acidophilus DSM 10332]